MASVVIPAHNEAAVIERCLRALLEGTGDGELEVVVSCNGCLDDTAERARSFGDAVRVIETSAASKSAALNDGDQVATGFPRFYLDADVVLCAESLRRVCRVLEGSALIASPRAEVDTRGCSRWVRSFYHVWLRLPYLSEDGIGSGVYALSRRGRERFDRFPEIIADDAFARLSFAPGERAIVADASFAVTPPRTLAGVIAIKARAHYGNLELWSRYPEMRRRKGRGHGRALLGLFRDPSAWVAIGIYVWVRVRARARARWKFHSGRGPRWERDETSRAAPAPRS